MPGIEEPVPRELARVLRAAVLAHARTERRRSYPALIHVGMPDAAELAFQDDPALDHFLRCDLLAALAAALPTAAGPGSPTPLIWITRTGDLTLQDVDAQWLAAARSAFGEAGRDPLLVVVNRTGWRDPRSGVERRWVRIRS